jgi:NADH-quinone oxidoreductase subunit M
VIAAVWLVCLAAPPLAVIALARLGLPLERVRAVAVVCAGLALAAAAAIFAVPALAGLRIAWPAAHPLLGDSVLRVNALSTPLIPLPAALWLMTVAVTPRARLDRGGLQRTALATLTATLAFLTESPALLVVLWSLSNLLFIRALAGPTHRRARRVAGLYVWASAALLAAGVLTGAWISEPLGLWLIVAAVLIRKGIFPFHAWIPEAFDSGRLGPVLVFCAPQLGAYVAVVLVVPHAGDDMLRAVAILSLITALYGAALAVIQRDARRACGYLFVSQSALVLAGLDCTTAEALAGSLVLWISSALAFTGVARTVLALEARRGRLDLTRYHGGYEQMPLLATSFLVLGLACTGFPGTLGFVGQEMLVEGAVDRFPALGLLVVVASAFTGLAVLRMYFSLFCGARAETTRLPLRRREGVVFATVAAVLVVSGLAARPIAISRLRASEMILERRVSVSALPAPRDPRIDHQRHLQRIRRLHHPLHSRRQVLGLPLGHLEHQLVVDGQEQLRVEGRLVEHRRDLEHRDLQDVRGAPLDRRVLRDPLGRRSLAPVARLQVRNRPPPPHDGGGVAALARLADDPVHEAVDRREPLEVLLDVAARLADRHIERARQAEV